MFSRTIVALTLICVGCADDSDTRPPLTNRTFVWASESRPYDVVGLGGSNVPRLGEQSRSASVVYADAGEKEQMAEAVREIYTELITDIKDAQPDAKYRHVNILVYDAEGEIDRDSGAWICSLSVDPPAGEAFPTDPSDRMQWQWRDPTNRPTQEEREIDWEYTQALKTADRSVEFPVSASDLLGLRAAGRRKVYEQTYPDEAAAAREQLSKTYNLSADELQSVLDRVLAWKYQEEVVTTEAAEAPAGTEAQEPLTEGEADSAGEATDSTTESLNP